jgi:hypothetical protein
MRDLSNDHIKYVLGIDIPLTESIAINERILAEQLLYESFLDTVINYAKGVGDKVVTTVTNWKDAAAVLARVLASPNLLTSFVKTLWQDFQGIILNKFKKFLEKAKLINLYNKYIDPVVKSIQSISEPWKKFLIVAGIATLMEYLLGVASQYGIDKIKDKISTIFAGNAILGFIKGHLTDFNTYLKTLTAFLGTAGAVAIEVIKNFQKALQPTIDTAKTSLERNWSGIINLKKYDQSVHEIKRLQKLAGII